MGISGGEPGGPDRPELLFGIGKGHRDRATGPISGLGGLRIR